MTADTRRHILIIVSDMGLGGAQRAAATLSNGFADRGHRVELIETYSAGGDCAYRLKPGG
jgi:GalNAc-alpha-(1->4)-GalNAc-alpha-(1->3)-diNAcBac-PP-undecaprenol alpha-1,4-N-acetyl-D-galactosaminyltransferase